MTISLRDRLAAKAKRRIVVPVEIGPPDPDSLVALAEAVLTGGDAAQAAADTRTDLVAEVAFVAATGSEFERVASAYPSPEGADAGMDWRSALPAMAALCAEDDSLQDEQAWADLISQWSHGERLTLWAALLRLNTAAPPPHLPKG